MSGAMARKPKAANAGSCSRHETESSGQPCRKRIGVALVAPQERKKVVCRPLLATCSRTGKVMRISDASDLYRPPFDPRASFAAHSPSHTRCKGAAPDERGRRCH